MKNILILDDDETFVAMIKAAVDTARYTVVSAGNGEDGLKKIGDFKPDIILLDIMMPKMNGIEFLKKLNETYGEGKTPVLITSNISSLEQISEGVSLGIRGYVVKSNESLQSIINIIDKTLKN